MNAMTESNTTVLGDKRCDVFSDNATLDVQFAVMKRV